MDPVRTRNQQVTYSQVARTLLASGLGSPLPLPRGRKSPPPDGWTGADAPDASAADVEAWIESHDDGNTGLRLAEGLIGLDVDAYGSKQGAVTMQRLLAELGPLPATVVITSRGYTQAGDPSGIRLYRIKGETGEVRDLGGNVEVLRRQHRYAVVAGNHPDTQAPYLWYDRGGAVLTQIPSIDQIPYLPQAWADRLRRPVARPAQAGPTVPGVPFAELTEAQRADILAYLDAIVKSETALFAEAATWAEGQQDSHGCGWQKMTADLAMRLGSLLLAPWTPITDEKTCKDVMQRIVPDVIAAAVNLDEEWARQWDRGGPAPMPAPRVSIEALAGEAAPPPPAPRGVVDSVSEPESGSGDVHSGQVRMAHRLAAAYRGRLLHTHGIGWFYFDGTRFVEDQTGHAERAVIDVLEQALIASLGDESLRSDVSKCESAAGISGVLQIARSLVEFACTTDDLDQNPALLNTLNGTLDLDTMQMRPHSPADRITKVTRAAYTPGATSPRWERFLAQILPDEQERAYLQRVFGQALYGRVEEHILPMLTGEGGNGKGVTYGTILHVLGSYGTVISPEMLLTQDRSNIPTEIMDLRGTRLAVASETNEGRKFDEAILKRLTGGDLIKARRLYRDPVEFVPSHTIAYVTNKLPRVSADSPAIWRRIRVVPFDVVVPSEHRDTMLQRRLESEADAILGWLIQGYVDYRRGGMAEPSKVQAATESYRNSSDPIQLFVAEACFTSPAAAASSRALYSAWQRWAQGRHVEPLSEVAFGKELDRLGYESTRRNTGMVRKGLMPLAEGGE